MAADCAIELKGTNVACVSLYPGAVKTEVVMHHMTEGVTLKSQGVDVIHWRNLTQLIPVNSKCKTRVFLLKFAETFKNGESIEYAGKAIVALMQGSYVNIVYVMKQ